MREALSGMTTRGRAFVAAGVTAALCAIILGEGDLLRVGVLLAALPLVTAFFLGRNRYRLGLVRAVQPGHVTAGQPARVQLDLTNDGRLPTGLLLLEEHVPYVLGTRPRFVVDRMGPRRRRTVGYLIRSEVRGKFRLGPMAVRVSDPFGLVEMTRTFQSTSALVVTPRVTPLPPIPLSGAWTGSGDNRPRAFASGSAEDVTVREYRRGDDLRRVHWRSSAHAGELMVRREEQPWQSRATLFLDNRRIAHRGAGAQSSLERAVEIAASAAVHLVQRGFAVRLVTAAGEEPGGSWHEHGALAAETGPLLESLAVVEHVDRERLDTGWLQDVGHAGLLIAVLGQVADLDRPAFSRMRHSAASALAVSLDVAAWSSRTRPSWEGAAEAPETADARWLTAHGWTATTAGPRRSLPELWQDLGTTGRSTHRARSGGTAPGRGAAS